MCTYLKCLNNCIFLSKMCLRKKRYFVILWIIWKESNTSIYHLFPYQLVLTRFMFIWPKKFQPIVMIYILFFFKYIRVIKSKFNLQIWFQKGWRDKWISYSVEIIELNLFKISYYIKVLKGQRLNDISSS